MQSIRTRMTVWLTLLMAGLSLGAAVFLYVYVRGVLTHQFDGALAERTHTLMSLVRLESDGKVGMDFSDLAMPEYQPGKRPEFFEAFLPDGKGIERSLSLKDGDLLDAGTIEMFNRGWDVTLPDGRPGRAYAVQARPRPDSDDRDERPPKNVPPTAEMLAAAPTITLVAARDRSQLERVSTVLLTALMIAVAGLSIFCVLVVRAVVTSQLKPIDRVASQAASIGPDTLAFRFDVQTLPSELKPICLRLNDLLQRLDDAFQRERRLNGDIAHELRTPIAELRSLSEVARLSRDDAGQLAVYLEDARDVAIRMESLVEALLALARSQSHRSDVSLAALPLGQVVRGVIHRNADPIERRSLRFDVSIAGGLYVLSDRLLFTRVIDNLIGNAVQHSPAGGCVQCRSEVIDDHTCVLRLTNVNQSLTQEDLGHLFQAFWRKDASRSDGARSGLGLALVREYCKHLGIEITASLPAPQRFEIALTLPIAAETDLPPAATPTAATLPAADFAKQNAPV